MIEPQFTTQTVDETRGYGKFVFEPLPASFAHTLGNSLRRTLLSSLEGTAITAVRIEGAPHLFSTLKGIKESALDIVLNLKQLRFEIVPGTHRLKISVKGARKVTGADAESEAAVVNKDFYIAEVTDPKASLEIDAIVETGYGFVASEDKESVESGFIAVDSSFSPVKKVNFNYEETRVGRKSNYEKLILEIWTDESITPSEALQKAAQILTSHFGAILSGEGTAPIREASTTTAVTTQEESNSKLDDIIIDELNLPSRVINALLRENIETVSDLVKTGRKKLIGLKGVGRKSIDLIDDELKKMSIELQ